MTTSVKFAGLLIWRVVLNPLLSVLALPLLVIAWVILSIVVFVWSTWEDAANVH